MLLGEICAVMFPWESRTDVSMVRIRRRNRSSLLIAGPLPGIVYINPQSFLFFPAGEEMVH